jgi:hypothetical protein
MAVRQTQDGRAGQRNLEEVNMQFGGRNEVGQVDLKLIGVELFDFAVGWRTEADERLPILPGCWIRSLAVFIESPRPAKVLIAIEAIETISIIEYLLYIHESILLVSTASSACILPILQVPVARLDSRRTC